MSEELKPCPHCGASGGDLAIRFTGYVEAPDITIDYFVHCFNCGAETGMSMNAKYAVKAWNRRVEPDEIPEWVKEKIKVEDVKYPGSTEFDEGFSAGLQWVLSLQRDK